MGPMRRTLVVSLAIAAGLFTAQRIGWGAQRDSPESYIPVSLDGLAVHTCRVDVGGASTCGPGTTGPGPSDSVRLGLAMMTAAGLTGSNDTRWEDVVYGATGTSCLDEGASIGAMRTQPGVSQGVREELAAVTRAESSPLRKADVPGLELYVGHLPGEGCTVAIGYPNDSTVLVTLTGKDDWARATRTIESMLGAASGTQP